MATKIKILIFTVNSFGESRCCNCCMAYSRGKEKHGSANIVCNSEIIYFLYCTDIKKKKSIFILFYDLIDLFVYVKQREGHYSECK